MGHPLDPLCAVEIRLAATVCRAAAKARGLPSIRFNTITLQEPPKAALVDYAADAGCVPPRRAFCILQAPPAASVVEVTVDLASQEAVTWTQVEGVQPLATPDDCLEAEALVKADARVRARLAACGLTDMALVACDPWSVHAAPRGGRLIQTFMYARSSPDDNQYAKPLDFVALVDLDQRAVVHIDAPYKEVPQLPKQDMNYHRSLQQAPWRDDIKPLNVEQPEGPSFRLAGNLLTWQRWRMRLGFNAREGLVLHDVGYEDSGRVRPILHRASLVEMAVPYGDPNPPFHRKCAFDVGDYGLGYCANSLELGCDCLGHIQYQDALLADSRGEPYEIRKAVCIHEEDAGLLWKHMDYRSGHAEARRSRRLVVSFIATVVNYEYCFYWHFYQDGTIKYEIRLTGELSTNLLSPGEEAPRHGTLVAPGVNAQHHQHMFCARLDPAVDDEQGGRALVVTEVNVEPMAEGPDNPHGNGFVAVETELATEKAAARCANAASARVWLVKNPASLHPVTGHPVAFKLVSAAAAPLMARPDSLIARRGAFAQRNLWVTPHADAERFPAGDYPLQSTGGAGLEAWTQQDRRVSGNDPVIWHCFGVTHIVRPEDFPVMPCESVGFALKPFGFFNGNPGVDIPPTINAASKLCCAHGAGAGEVSPPHTPDQLEENGGDVPATNGDVHSAHGVIAGNC